jgi:hypothetical protein
MNDTIGIIVVIVAVVCMIIAQRKSTPRPTRTTYAFLGSVASIMIATEAAHRNEPGVLFLFAAAAAMSLLGIALDYLKPTKPGA